MRSLGRVTVGLVLPALLLIGWWLLSADSTSLYFPPLSEILTGFVDTWISERFVDDVLPGVGNLLAGFGIAIVLGVGVGTVLGLSERARRDVWPLTEYGRALPMAALVPLAFAVIGPGAQMEISLIAFATVWPILVNTIDGVRGVDRMLIDTARIYGLSAGQRLRSVVLPAAMPQIAAGVRVALAIAVAAMVVANMFGSATGLGAFVIQAQQSFDVLGTWTGLIMIGLIGLTLNLMFALIQHYGLAWHRGWRRASSTEGVG